MGKVAVVTPTRNRAGTPEKHGYLEECIYSVRMQNYDNIVHIVVDDGSDDMTEDLVKFHKRRNPDKLVYIRMERECNDYPTASRATNEGINAIINPQNYGDDSEMLEGTEYFSMLHSDDILTGESVKERVHAMEETQNVGMCYGGMINFGEIDGLYKTTGYMVNVDGELPIGRIHDDLLHMLSPFPNQSIMVKMGVMKGVGPYDEKLTWWEDVDMTLSLMEYCNNNGLSISGLGNGVYYYRQHSGSICRLNSKEMREKKKNDVDTARLKHTDMASGLTKRKAELLLKRPQIILPNSIRFALSPLKRVIIPKSKEFYHNDDFLCSIKDMESEFFTRYENGI